MVGWSQNRRFGQLIDWVIGYVGHYRKRSMTVAYRNVFVLCEVIILSVIVLHK